MRISAGSLRGRRLPVPRRIRPTAGRTREALFDIWSGRLAGARFLDLYAGSGGVGLEAASRGAELVVLVEGEARIVRQLRALCDELAPERVTVLRADLPAELADLSRRLATTFDLVFADPPYRFRDFPRLLAGIESLLGPQAEVAIEHSCRLELPERIGRLERGERRGYGGSCLSLYRLGARGTGRGERPADASGAQEEGQLLQVDLDVNAFQQQRRTGVERHRGEVQHRPDSGPLERLAAGLSCLRRHRQQGDPGSGPANDLGQVAHVMDDQMTHPEADLLGVRVEAGDDPEGALIEFQIAGQRAAKPAHADDRQAVLAIETQQPAEPFDQRVHLVTDTADPELAELRQILSYQGGRHAQPLRQLLRRNPGDALIAQLPQAAQVE